MPLRTPRSPTGSTSGLPRWNMACLQAKMNSNAMTVGRGRWLRADSSTAAAAAAAQQQQRQQQRRRRRRRGGCRCAYMWQVHTPAGWARKQARVVCLQPSLTETSPTLVPVSTPACRLKTVPMCRSPPTDAFHSAQLALQRGLVHGCSRERLAGAGSWVGLPSAAKERLCMHPPLPPAGWKKPLLAALVPANSTPCPVTTTSHRCDTLPCRRNRPLLRCRYPAPLQHSPAILASDSRPSAKCRARSCR